MSQQLSLIIPTYNERNNIEPLVKLLDSALKGIAWEAVFVDDNSKDGTRDIITQLAGKDDRIRIIHRIGRRGLSSACIEGMLATTAPFIAVMDADLQHDEKLLPVMLKQILEKSDLDIVVGSRYVDQGSFGNLASRRKWISQFATNISRLLIKSDLKDSMSGFFMLRRTFLNLVVERLSGKGFKILLDIFASSPIKVRFSEIPYKFRSRQTGESKLDTLVIWEYVVLLADKCIGKVVPFRFILFVMVGLAGSVLHLLILLIGLKGLNLNFLEAQMAATFVAMTSNYTLDNIFTYRDMRLKGKSFLIGLMSFYIVCSIGAFVNIQIAFYLYNNNITWWLAGLLGALVGAVWNYAVSMTVTWRKKS